MAYFIGRILGGNFFSIIAVMVGMLFYKVGKSDLELSQNTSEESFSDITKKS